ncbi:MAG: glucosidase [Chloroflexota bacterium]
MNYNLQQTAEFQRLSHNGSAWKGWGTYVSDRAWGTVREDYSANGDAWGFFPHDHARSRAYRWNEDGLAGVCNRWQNLCLGVALWNEQDPILKERFFGLTGPQGNHGEDVKEYYFYLDATPTHSYAKMLYKYPQVAYPYAALEAANGRLTRNDPEYELIDALGDAWQQQRYFDVFVEYAKASPTDILCRITAVNRAPDPAPLHILPHIWFRNDWSWGYPNRPKPALNRLENVDGGITAVSTTHRHLRPRYWYARLLGASVAAPLHICDNETNYERLFGVPNPGAYVKDGIHEAVVNGRSDRTSPDHNGTKAAVDYRTLVPAGGSVTVQVRLTTEPSPAPFATFDATFAQRLAEADEFYAALQPATLSDDAKNVQRQALAGLLWNKQFYHYGVELWLDGDPAGPKPPASRRNGRNAHWPHLDNLDVISMPDKWEYPWYAVWDIAFHTIPLAMVDPFFAKEQLLLFLREWYMHPNGQIPAYEWSLGDVNPPVHAWAAWRVYQIDRDLMGQADVAFLEKVFHKLLLNFTWWVNRKDAAENNIFEGGFLGLDNIGVFDRSSPLPGGGFLEQADGTAWMGMYCLNMLAIALELARHNPAYEDIATKFFEHFIYIANAINQIYGQGDGVYAEGTGLWDETDGFYYDMIRHPDGHNIPMKLRSLVGLIPLYAVETLEPELLQMLPSFQGRLNWFVKNRPNLVANVASLVEPGENGRFLLSLVSRPKLERILTRMFDPAQFLSDYGLRALSKEYAAAPFHLRVGDQRHTVRYEPAESGSGLFGGNSNWRGPIWFPVNYLMIESLQKYHHYYSDSLQVEMPHGSAQWMNLNQAAAALGQRLTRLFLRDAGGKRPFFGPNALFQTDPHWRDHLLFYEYFHGDNGAGLGASHQTGWTALVAKLLQDRQ